MTSCKILGVRVDISTYQQLCDLIESWILENSSPQFCCYTNPHSIVMTQSDAQFRKATLNADRVLADGSGLLWASKILRLDLKERVTGPTSMLRVIEHGLNKDFKHYFYGASEECLETLSETLSTNYPGIQIAGTQSPPFRELSETELEESIAKINDSGANILWIGLGAPKQEKWIFENRHRLKPNVVLGVGAAFDYHAGIVKWAPKWIRSIGLEWAYRLVQQPRRLFARNLNSFYFLMLVLRYGSNGKFESGKSNKSPDEARPLEKDNSEAS